MPSYYVFTTMFVFLVFPSTVYLLWLKGSLSPRDVTDPNNNTKRCQVLGALEPNISKMHEKMHERQHGLNYHDSLFYPLTSSPFVLPLERQTSFGGM